MTRGRLLTATAMTLVAFSSATAAWAQEAPATTAATADTQATVAQAAPTDAAPAAQADTAGPDVVVTGSILRQNNTSTASPITTLTAENLDQRGQTNIADAIRSTSADSAGSISSAFGNGFASGASGVSLRGLSVNSTLVLFDGLRPANYPLADDGERAFADLNTIPDAIVDRVEILKDGASSIYGSDAIAGVVNVILKKQITGIQGRAEGGISQQGDADHQRVSLTAGIGDLATRGWNFYVSGEYDHDGIVRARDRRFPYNTKDLSSIGGLNLNPGATGVGATEVAVVRPGTTAIPGNLLSGVAVPGTLYRPLPGNCGSEITHTDASGTYCEEPLATRYATLQPEVTRYGGTAHLTVDLSPQSQAYGVFTYYRSRTFLNLVPNSIQGTSPVDFSHILLPAVLSNGQRNPNDPYAAQGLGALIYYRFADAPYIRQVTNQTYRGAVGVSGRFGDDWRYSVDATAMKSTLEYIQTGYANIPALLSAIQDGSYNFVNPALNTQAVRNAVFPVIRTHPSSELYMIQGNISRSVAQLPGGPLQIGVGAAVRHEKTNDPSANPNLQTLSLNSFSAVGDRTVESGSFEIDAPVLSTLDISASGRYDHYSEGFGNFSPKVGAKFTPIPQLAFRGTFSRGFRAPSIPEVSGTVLGYAASDVPPAAVIAAHNNDAYVAPYRIGYQTTGTPNLKPEKSRSFTAGVVVQPTHAVSLTVDYYNIRKTDVITAGPQSAAAIAAYYAGTALPAGYTVTLNLPDQDAPNAIRTVAFVNGPYVNSASFETSGIDIQLQGKFNLASNASFFSSLEATEIFKSNLTDAGVIQHYVGTEGPFNVSASVGTPRWKGNWQNTLQVGPFSLTGTAYYVDGYKATAEDKNPGTSGQDCSNGIYGTTVAQKQKFCKVNSFIDVDLVGSVAVTPGFSFYLNVINVLGAHAPLNAANYGVGNSGANYNSAYAQNGVIGRQFRAGATFKF